MKKFVAVLSAAAMMTTLAACGSTADTTASSAAAEATASAAESTADTAAKSYKVAIVQQLDHASLDEIRVAIEAELDAKAAEKGIAIEYKDFNGQNDATTLNQIGTQVVSDGYDAVIPIATLAAQCMTTACESTKTPVIYAAISDPAAADLTDIDYVTGTSDALNTQSIMDMMFAVQPDIQTVGLLYCSAEPNSVYQCDVIEGYLTQEGYTVARYAFTDTNDVTSVAQTAADNSDVIYIPTDNTAASNTEAIANVVLPAKVPVVAGEEGICNGCGVATLSISYYDLGHATGEMAAKILAEGGDISTMPVEYAPNVTKKYNAANCEALGITPPDGYEAIG